jgi:hypothetical protein
MGIKKAIGKHFNGNINYFKLDGDGNVYCYNEKLYELDLPEGVKRVYCRGNYLTELHIPDSAERIICDDVNLTGNLTNCEILIDL